MGPIWLVEVLYPDFVEVGFPEGLRSLKALPFNISTYADALGERGRRRPHKAMNTMVKGADQEGYEGETLLKH